MEAFECTGPIIIERTSKGAGKSTITIIIKGLGVVVAIGDVNIDGNYVAQFPGVASFRKVGPNLYTGTLEGRNLEITVIPTKKKTLFTVRTWDQNYSATGTGEINGTTFTGLFWDQNGTKGEFRYTKR